MDTKWLRNQLVNTRSVLGTETVRWHGICMALCSGRSSLGRSLPYCLLRDIRDERMTDSAPTPRDSRDTAPTVLIVEDEPVIRELMSMLLEDEGYVVHQAVDGLEALETVEQHTVDLVLSDVKMPRLDGASLARHLRARGDPIPVVLMSAVYAEVDLPGVRFLRKPVNCEHLLDIIAAALRESHLSTRGGGLDDWTSPAPFAG